MKKIEFLIEFLIKTTRLRFLVPELQASAGRLHNKHASEAQRGDVAAGDGQRLNHHEYR